MIASWQPFAIDGQSKTKYVINLISLSLRFFLNKADSGFSLPFRRFDWWLRNNPSLDVNIKLKLIRYLKMR